MSGIALYTASSGVVEVRVEGRDVWLRQEQIAALFGRDRTVIGRHIRNVFADGELEAASVCANFAHTVADGKTYQVEHHNLDLIIAVASAVGMGSAGIVGYHAQQQQPPRLSTMRTRRFSFGTARA